MNTNISVKFSIFFLLIVLISACTSQPTASVPCTILQQHSRCVAVSIHDDLYKNNVKMMKPAPVGFGYLYITRPYSQHRSIKSKLYIDDVLVAELGPMSFARVKVRSGMHEIKIKTERMADVSIPVEMDGDAFFEYQIRDHFFSSDPSIQSVSKAHAKKTMQTLDMVVSRDE